MKAANTKELPQNRNNYCWSPLRYSIYGRVEKEQKERVKFAFVCASKARVWNRQRIEKDNNSEAAHSLKPKRRKRRGPVAPPEGGCVLGHGIIHIFTETCGPLVKFISGLL